MTEAVRISETSVYSDTTRRYIPESSNLHFLKKLGPVLLDPKICHANDEFFTGMKVIACDILYGTQATDIR
jgi:hypothetical protein